MTRLVSIILPTYNERDNVVELIQAIHRAMRGAELATEVIVVDDDSPDGTAEAVQQRFRGQEPVRVIRRVGERGLATAILRGLREAHGDVVVIMDTDFNHDPRRIPMLVRYLEDFDIVVGSRFVAGGGMEGPAFRYWGSYLFNAFIKLVLGVRTNDNLSGFFATRRRFLEDFPLESIFRGYGDYFIRLLYAAKDRGCSILEIPVVYAERPSGQSKTRFLRHTLQYTWTVLAIRLKSWLPGR